jgi:hypothetical protein
MEDNGSIFVIIEVLPSKQIRYGIRVVDKDLNC